MAQRIPRDESLSRVDGLGALFSAARGDLVEDGEPRSPGMVATAVELASKRRRGIHVRAMPPMPTHPPPHAEMPEREVEEAKPVEAAAIAVSDPPGQPVAVPAGPAAEVT